MINICICIDRNLQNQIWPCYNSIMRNTKEEVKFYILCLDNVYKPFIEKYKHMGMVVVSGKSDLEIKLNDNFVSSKAMYLRFYIPILFPHIDKMIYTECDSVYDSDIKDHWDIDIGDNYIGAVRDPFWEKCSQIQFYSGKVKENIDLDIPAYLSGNLIINCKVWRENNITQQLIDIVKENNIRVNLSTSIICKDKIFELDKKWCMLASHKDFGNTKGIYHWSGVNKKPWNNKNVLNYKVWNKYT